MLIERINDFIVLRRWVYIFFYLSDRTNQAKMLVQALFKLKFLFKSLEGVLDLFESDEPVFLLTRVGYFYHPLLFINRVKS